MTAIALLQGDITKIEADAIVNAANSSLLGGGGVDGAIHRAGGSKILEECRMIRARQGKCATGEAVITTAGNLPAKYVIHTVGPVFQKENQVKLEALLANCYHNSLSLAVENQCKTIAFPNISTGIYRFPKLAAAQVAIATVQAFITKSTTLEKVIFVCFDEENHTIYHQLLKE